jgi:hypothetical protein
MSAADDVGIRFVKALAAKDAAALLDVLSPDVDFRALTPGRAWEASTAKEVVDDIVLRHWFEPDDHIDALERIEPGESTGPRHRIGYRVRVKNPNGTFDIDQQAYFEVDNERISWLRVMCAGFVRADTTTATNC